MNELVIKNKLQQANVFNKIGLYFIFGAIWSLAQVGYPFPILSWFTFIPFMFFIRNEKYKSGFFYAWIYGGAVYLFNLWWMPLPIATNLFDFILPGYLQFIGWIVGVLLTLLVCSFQGLMYSLAFIISKFITAKYKQLFYFILALVITVLDYFFLKLWHDQIGYSQYGFLYISQIADLFGISGITFLILISNAIILSFGESILLKKNGIISNVLLIIFSIIIIILYIYGYVRINQIKEISNEMNQVKIGLVQGNFSGLDKKYSEKIYDMIIRYNELSQSLLKDNPDLIIWPETAIPILCHIDVENYYQIKKFYQVPLLTGLHLNEYNSKKQIIIYNSLVLISSTKYKLDYYNKIKLLPFAERFPISFLNFLLNMGDIQDFTPGNEQKIMILGKIKFSPNICYEAIIPEFIRHSLNINGIEANLIINATNDSWYGNTIEPNMHLRMAGFRAIENRKSFVRVTCTGYSACFNPAGEIIYRSALLKEDSITKQVPLMEIKSVYREWGWLFIWFLFLLLIVIFIIRLINKIIITRRYSKTL